MKPSLSSSPSATAVVPAGQTNLTQILPVIQSLDDSLIAGVAAQLSASGLIDRMVNEDWLAETESARQLALDYFYQRVP